MVLDWLTNHGLPFVALAILAVLTLMATYIFLFPRFLGDF